MVNPPKNLFMERVRYGGIPPLYVQLPFLPPSVVFELFLSPQSFLLESIKGPEKIARYSFIGFEPCLIMKIKDGLTLIESSASYAIRTEKPLDILKALMCRYKQLPHPHLPPFQGGVAGMLGYDFSRYLERLPVTTIDDLGLPDAHFFFVDTVLAFDHVVKKMWLIMCPGMRDSIISSHGSFAPCWSSYYDEAEQRLFQVAETIQRISPFAEKIAISPMSRTKLTDRITIHSDIPKEEYLHMVNRAKEYIAAGDIFQANLSQRVSAPVTDIRPWDLYRMLSAINPAPFAAFLDCGEYQIVSSSPERLLRINRGIVETRPIAGTRPRGRDRDEDRFMRSDLLLNEKERAEHIMLIDLERNDLGRVCAYGTVTVDEFMITEDCSHVMHIVSNIRGKLAEGRDTFDAIRAAFPGGTITGVPKVRCMEIIDELEPYRRGPYTGSIGYIGFNGTADFNIIIRSFVIKGGISYVQVGAGIVADSHPAREYEETLKKAEALMETLHMVSATRT